MFAVFQRELVVGRVKLAKGVDAAISRAGAATNEMIWEYGNDETENESAN